MLTNLNCRIFRQCTTLFIASRYFPRFIFGHGKPLLLPTPELQKWIDISRQFHGGVPTLQNVTNNIPPATALSGLEPKILRNKSAKKIIVEKLKSTNNPQNSYDENEATITPVHFCRALDLPFRVSNLHFKKYRELYQLTQKNLTERFINLIKCRIYEDRIKIAPWLLLRPFEEFEALAKDVVRILKVPLPCAIPLTNIPITVLERMSSKWSKEVNELEEFKDGKFSNRMEYLADRLKLSTEDIAFMVSRYVGISLRPFGSLQSILQFLEEAGITSEDIFKEPYILTNWRGPSKMLRIKSIIQEYKIKNVKPWMFCVRECVLRERLKKQRRELDLLSGHSNVRSFLQTELNCTSSDVDRMVTQIPNFHSLKASKIRDTVTFLTSKGYSTEDILTSPRVFHSSVDTMESRHEQLVEIGATGFKVSTLCLKSRNYMKLLKKFECIVEEEKAS